MTQHPPALLHEWVLTDFGLDLAQVERVGHGADDSADLWQADATDGRSYAVKLSGGGSAAGLVVAARLAEHGVAGVVPPLRARDGGLWTVREGRRLSVVPWVPEERALTAGMARAHWTAYGRLLAAVHAMPVTDELREVLPTQHPDVARAAAGAAEADRRLHREPGAAQVTGRVTADDSLVTALAGRWQDERARVLELLDGLEDLGRRLRTRTAPVVVCHGDPHLGNVLVAEPDRVWLLDWDDALVAQREADLMFVVGGVLAFAPVTAEDQAAFFDGYGETRIDPLRLAYYLCARALVDVADFALEVLDEERPVADRYRALDIVRGLFSADGLVSLAVAALRGIRPVPPSGEQV